MNLADLNSFLKLGYFLDYKNPRYQLKFDSIEKDKYEDAGEEELIELGIGLFNNAISKKYKKNQKNVVPLSGGLDSRAILGSLLHHTEASNIKTYTFGTPGTYDYEIGKQIAQKLGTNHISLDLTKEKYIMDDLLEMSKRVNHQTVLFHHPPVSHLDNLIGDSIVWSGAIIDVFFGRHKHIRISDNEIEAKRNFIRENTYQDNITLTSDEGVILKDIDFIKETSDKIGLEHYLDLVNRQLKFIAPHVLANDYNYNVLFDDKELVDFTLNLPIEYIEDQYLYKKMLLYGFPELFRIPNKTTYGLNLDSPESIVKFKRKILSGKFIINRYIKIFKDPLINYIDFENGIRERGDLRNIVKTNIMDLKDRQLINWIDIDKIWLDYFNNNKPYARALIILTSLEIHLKSKLMK